MDIIVLALIGLPAGLALDALVTRLAVAPEDWNETAAPEQDAGGVDGEPEEAGDEPSREGAAAFQASVHAEAGSLVVGGETVWGSWTRRLLIVGATVGLFAASAARFDEPAHLAIVAAYLSVLLVCAATDALTFRVPNVVTYPAMAGALAVGAAMPDADVLEVIAGGALAGGVLLLPALLTGGVGMGMGDVKLAAFVGLTLGFAHVAPALLLMAIGGGGVALILLVTGARKRGEPIPYAPFISAGAMAGILWQGTAFVSLT
jgi:Flp pilus assembly protein protease CpaA